MEQKIEREWKSIVCPDWKEKAMIMCEWDILSEKGSIHQRTLKQIDCHNPGLTEFGGADCSWLCEKAIAKEGTKRSGMQCLLVCAILAAGIFWVVFYDICMSPYMSPRQHFYGVFLFFGIPFLIGLMIYSSWKVIRCGCAKLKSKRFLLSVTKRESFSRSVQ